MMHEPASPKPLSFLPYEQAEEAPNIVIDGSPNKSTVLTLTHWPGIAQPPGFQADLSAEMAFKYLDDPPEHAPAEFVTNNHFDQDGLVGIHALINPTASLPHRETLIDVAAAGDFGTYRFRSAARVSMALWSYAQPERSPLGTKLNAPYPEVCALLYQKTLPLLVPMIVDPDRFADLWRDEDEQLSASEKAVTDGRVRIEEVGSVDLAVVTIEDDSLTGGHRFASGTADFIHPMAVNNATNCCRLLLIRGNDYLYIDRYETWVQYRTRSLPKRVDLGPLADRLTEQESGQASWSAGKPSSLAPELRPDRSSSIKNQTLQDLLVAHLQEAPIAWDPFQT